MRPTGSLRTAALIVFLGFSTLAPIAIAQQGDARRAYLAGNGFLSRGMNELAVKEYQEFLEQSPQHADAPTARYGMGVALHRLGRNEEAIAALDRLEDQSGFRFASESRVVAATAEFALGRFEAVVSRIAPNIDSLDDQSLSTCAPLLIESLHRMDEHRQAIDTTTAIIDRSGFSATGARGLCFAALSAEREQESTLALEWASWVVERGGDEQLEPIASMCVARLLLASDDADGAGRIASRIVNQGPVQLRVEALQVLSQSLTMLGRTDDADRVLAQLQHESDDSADGVLIQRGVIAFENEQFEQALRFFSGCDDNDELVARWAAKCESRLGRHDSAAERLSSIEHPSAVTLYELGVSLNNAGQTDRAATIFEQFLQANHEDPALNAHAQLALATIEHAQANYSRSAARCREILTNADDLDSPLAPRTRLLLAENLYLDNDLPGAKAAFKRCIDTDPGSESTRTAMYRLGMISAQLGENETAETLLRAVTRGNATPPAFTPGLRTLGDLAMAREDWQAAIASHRAYLATDPSGNQASTHLKLGIALSRSGQSAQAMDSLTQSMGFGVDQALLARAYLERGEVRAATGDREGAESDWADAMKHGRDTEIATTAGLRLASITMSGGDSMAAQEHLRTVIETTSDSTTRAVASLDLGRLQLQSGDNIAAVQTLHAIEAAMLPPHRTGEAAAAQSIAASRSGDDQTAERADQNYRSAQSPIDDSLLAALLYERAWRYRRLDDHRGALAAYEELLRGTPSKEITSSARIEAAELLIEAGDTNRASAYLREVLEQADAGSPVIADAAMRLGNLHFSAGEFGDAADAFSRVLDQSDPDDRTLDQARLLCGESNHQLGLWATAIPFLEIAARSEDIAIAEPSLLRLGSCAAELQRWSVSESAYQQHIDRFPASDRLVQSLFGIGWALEASGDPESAIDLYRQAAQGSTETAARAQFQFGECLFALGRHEEATSEFIKVDILFSSPQWSAAALYEAGRCFDALGNREQASQQWRRVIEIDKSGKWTEMARARLGDTSKQVITSEQHTDIDTNSID